MTYNANSIVEKKVVIESPLGGKKAQVGYDLSVCNIEKITRTSEQFITINEDSKLENVDYRPVGLDPSGYYTLEPNTQYAVTFDQGCSFANNEYGRIISRSSLNRAGVIVLGVVFDPGFSTKHIGCTLYTGRESIRIHNHARLAQMQVFECESLADNELYSGRWQGLANHS